MVKTEVLLKLEKKILHRGAKILCSAGWTDSVQDARKQTVSRGSSRIIRRWLASRRSSIREDSDRRKAHVAEGVAWSVQVARLCRRR